MNDEEMLQRASNLIASYNETLRTYEIQHGLPLPIKYQCEDWLREYWASRLPAGRDARGATAPLQEGGSGARVNHRTV